MPGKALVTSVRKVLFSHLRMSQQCLRLATVGSREDSAAAWRACSARNMRWIQTRGARVRVENSARAYRQCGPRRPQPNCSRACFFERRSADRTNVLLTFRNPSETTSQDYFYRIVS